MCLKEYLLRRKNSMTNYEKLMKDMTIEKLAMLIACDLENNPCLHCDGKNNLSCDFCSCLAGIEEWLKQDAEDEAD